MVIIAVTSIAHHYNKGFSRFSPYLPCGFGRFKGGSVLRRFRWFGVGGMAAGADLRALGWHFVCDNAAEGGTLAVEDAFDGSARPIDLPDCPIVIDGGQLALSRWPWLTGNGRSPARMRRWSLIRGVDDGRERTRLLRLGFGDVMGNNAPLDEVEARAARIAEMADSLCRYRHHGGLKLDLLLREGFVAGKALGLHPREFALIWRLMETPGEPVEKVELLREVWRLSFVPETNSLAVHVSRLRSKLARAGLEGVVQTGLTGGYSLVAGFALSRRIGRLPGQAAKPAVQGSRQLVAE